ncbi:hypothetical protein B0T14DRAFT_86562 [Immersiella caudata]|uniref:Uncharacterized protein n=1 Tax=Immersiella caudata TaxID=314043 RepID=A0AA40CE67_9PEZI|nr:hypothetical protein B0T14DRAFT_86562 [Immersiella caudata]
MSPHQTYAQNFPSHSSTTHSHGSLRTSPIPHPYPHSLRNNPSSPVPYPSPRDPPPPAAAVDRDLSDRDHRLGRLRRLIHPRTSKGATCATYVRTNLHDWNRTTLVVEVREMDASCGISHGLLGWVGLVCLGTPRACGLRCGVGVSCDDDHGKIGAREKRRCPACVESGSGSGKPGGTGTSDAATAPNLEVKSSRRHGATRRRLAGPGMKIDKRTRPRGDLIWSPLRRDGMGWDGLHLHVLFSSEMDFSWVGHWHDSGSFAMGMFFLLAVLLLQYARSSPTPGQLA